MESLYLLVPIALIFLVLAIVVLFWAVNGGQYDDLDTEAHRILFDEKPGAKTKEPGKKASSEQGATHSDTTDINDPSDS